MIPQEKMIKKIKIIKNYKIMMMKKLLLIKKKKKKQNMQ